MRGVEERCVAPAVGYAGDNDVADYRPLDAVAAANQPTGTVPLEPRPAKVTPEADGNRRVEQNKARRPGEAGLQQARIIAVGNPRGTINRGGVIGGEIVERSWHSVAVGPVEKPIEVDDRSAKMLSDGDGEGRLPASGRTDDADARSKVGELHDTNLT